MLHIEHFGYIKQTTIGGETEGSHYPEGDDYDAAPKLIIEETVNVCLLH